MYQKYNISILYIQKNMYINIKTMEESHWLYVDLIDF